MRTWLVTLLGIVVLAASTAAHAAGDSVAGVDEDVPYAIALHGPGGSELATYSPTTAGKGATRRGPKWICRYYLPAPNEFGVPAPAVGTDAVVPEEGVTYAFICVDAGNGAQTYGAFRTYDPADPLGGLYAGERAAELAISRLPLPDPDLRTSPPAGSFQLVGVPTWFWVADPWSPQAATASVGTVAATVTAVPRLLEVDTGDGGHLTCRGPGIEWVEGRESTCAHTYTSSSRAHPGGRYPVTATVTWDVSWTATDGDAGDLGALTRTVALDLLVQEAQAVTD